jgi:hypothetical protein
MLLQQLADKKVLNFEVKNPSQDPPKSLICINAQLYVGQMIKLSIRPHEFAEAFTEFKKYGQRVTTKLKRASKSAKLDVVVGILTVDGFTIKFQTNTDMYDLLRMILEDRETRTQDWTYEEAKHYLSNSNLIDGNDFLRHTGNNINRRIKEVTGGSIPKFLESTTKSIRLNGEFV